MKRITLVCTVVAIITVCSIMHPAVVLPQSGKELLSIPGAKIVSGTVSYRERMDLPQTAMVHVELIDMSVKDPRKALLGEDSIWPAGIKLPVSFRIAYDPARIDPAHIYTVRARITDGEKTLFVSSSMTHVLTKGAPAKIELIVVPVSTRY